MNFLVETLRVLLLSVYYALEALVRLVVPPRRKSVRGEIVLVTGAGSGIGRLLSLHFARLGSTLVLWDINKEGNEESGRLSREQGAPRVYTYLCDCSQRADVYRVADQVKREVGDVSILINNAGIVSGKKFMDVPDNLLEKTLEVNTLAHFWTYKAFLPAMIASNHGHLVSIASSAGMIGVNGLADYCSSKFAALGFAESIAMELLKLGKNGIKTTIACPYFINTGMFDGCQTKWPLLLPILDSHYASKRIVDAILREQVILVMPRSLYIVIALKNILPVKLGILLGDYLGAFQIMDKFKGHPKKD
ncbi:epidermal retinol dehydrogenase 2 isoform X1 [Callorhinchus milii]|uniref:epidermal retinol dehydrogenase 2 isoform X1 n=1 Tax=Callorhinchus milii TaxID=7868 RepID=UPI0004575D47|nr:epidermal retinol dehydrogenase 2 isoform X1 [Callorhinchus milii]|eukprot:gi/632947741/ref/XP_007889201.1/ PREDICTED: epidermal retinol dehydrogenase 2 isoform X1 [Callorhinchus milii]